MKDKEILECAESVYEFLLDDSTKKYSRQMILKRMSSFEDIPTLSNMMKTLRNYNIDMVEFTMYLNDKYNIHESCLFNSILTKSPKEFFSTTKAKDFYKIIIRNLKIELLLLEEYE
jgi:uncharacterized pyridoxamine 5'-phosphate oxidase family protein